MGLVDHTIELGGVSTNSNIEGSPTSLPQLLGFCKVIISVWVRVSDRVTARVRIAFLSSSSSGSSSTREDTATTADALGSGSQSWSGLVCSVARS